MPNFIIDSFRGGLSDYEDKGPAGSFKAGSRSIDIRKKTDSLTCQQALIEEAVTGGLLSLPNFFVVASDGYTYAFCRGGHIYRGNRTTKVWTLVYTDANGAITGASEWYDKYNSTTYTYLMWATATRLNCKVIPGASNWSDVNTRARGDTWPKTNLTSATWHTMKPINGLLEIANGSSLAQVGYNDGSYTTSSLDVIPGNNITTLIERSARTAVLGCSITNRDQASLFEWDGDDSWMNKNIIPVGPVNNLIDGEKPLMQVGTNGYLYYSLFDQMCPLTQFPGGGQVNPGGSDIDNGLIVFGVWGNGTGNSGLYTFGRKYLAHPIALNLDYPFDCDEIGAVIKSGTDLLVSYKSGSSYGIKRVDTTAKAIGYYYSLDLKAPDKAINQQPKWASIKLTTAAMPAGTRIECYFDIDKSGTFVKAKMPDVYGGSTADMDKFQTVGAKEAIFQSGTPGKYFDLLLVLTPNGNVSPEIRKIEPYFE